MKSSARNHVLPKLRSVLSDWLKKDKQGMTQWNLAHIAELDLGYIKQIETGRRPVTDKVARSISECTGISEEWLLGMKPMAQMTNTLGKKYTKADFLRATGLSGKDSDPVGTRFLAFKYAIRVERMIRMLGKTGKEFLIRLPLHRELEKLEIKFKLDTEHPEEEWQDGDLSFDGDDWQSGAETFSERWKQVCDERRRIVEAKKYSPLKATLARQKSASSPEKTKLLKSVSPKRRN